MATKDVLNPLPNCLLIPCFLLLNSFINLRRSDHRCCSEHSNLETSDNHHGGVPCSSTYIITVRREGALSRIDPSRVVIAHLEAIAWARHWSGIIKLQRRHPGHTVLQILRRLWIGTVVVGPLARLLGHTSGDFVRMSNYGLTRREYHVGGWRNRCWLRWRCHARLDRVASGGSNGIVSTACGLGGFWRVRDLFGE